MDKPYLNETPVSIKLTELQDGLTDLIFRISGEYDCEALTETGRIDLEPLQAI